MGLSFFIKDKDFLKNNPNMAFVESLFFQKYTHQIFNSLKSYLNHKQFTLALVLFPAPWKSIEPYAFVEVFMMFSEFHFVEETLFPFFLFRVSI